MPFNPKSQSRKEEIKSAKELKEEIRVEQEKQKALYGAGQDGWTAQTYKRIKEAYHDNRVTITGRPQDIHLLLAENKPEEDLTDEERLLLLAYVHIKEEIVIGVPISPSVEWHRLTNWKFAKQWMERYPAEYKRAINDGKIPPEIKEELEKESV